MEQTVKTYEVSENLESISFLSVEEQQERFVEMVGAWIADELLPSQIDAVNAALADAFWFVR